LPTVGHTYSYVLEVDFALRMEATAKATQIADGRRRVVDHALGPVGTRENNRARRSIS